MHQFELRSSVPRTPYNAGSSCMSAPMQYTCRIFTPSGPESNKLQHNKSLSYRERQMATPLGNIKNEVGGRGNSPKKFRSSWSEGGEEFWKARRGGEIRRLRRSHRPLHFPGLTHRAHHRYRERKTPWYISGLGTHKVETSLIGKDFTFYAVSGVESGGAQAKHLLGALALILKPMVKP
ncbi:hypothetical protein VNO77_44237 [Canavalia gladiata]|uniref:Uncharacterized protein n=1 Tax=Canavalia gladiata TaxID=3824 RepID=A0AAN9JZB4_CANGL